MLKKRIIPVLFLRHGFLVRSENFSLYQNLGNPVTQVQRYNDWDVDELIYIDITPDDNYDYRREDMGRDNPDNPLEILEMVAKKSFMPLCFGGKITSLEDIRARMQRGADKVTLNSAILDDPDFINSAASHFGSQAIVASIDVRSRGAGEWDVYSHGGMQKTEYEVREWVREAEGRGVGEIFLNSVDRDGKATGLDLDLTKAVADVVNIPLITCGGIGDFIQFKNGFLTGGADAVAAGNIFNFKEFSYQMAKKDLHKHQIEVR